MADNAAIRPFHFEALEADLVDLRHRIKATKWPEREQVTDASQGVQLATMQKLARYWANSYDWRKCEARINAVPKFITEIDGLDIHFIHVRSRHDNALPMIVTHGWPGSIIEQMKIIDPLTNPTAHGATAADAFHLVIPSLPGYGFSGKPTPPGWNPAHRARVGDAHATPRLHEIRRAGRRLGQCGFRDDGVAAAAGTARHSHQHGGDRSAGHLEGASAGGPPPAGLSPEERHAWDSSMIFYKKGLGYANEMSLRPQTLYGIAGFADRPCGAGSSITTRSYAMIARVFDGQPEGLIARRRSRQHHALLGDEHRALFGSSLLGQQMSRRRRLLRREET